MEVTATQLLGSSIGYGSAASFHLRFAVLREVVNPHVYPSDTANYSFGETFQTGPLTNSPALVPGGTDGAVDSVLIVSIPGFWILGLRICQPNASHLVLDFIALD